MGQKPAADGYCYVSTRLTPERYAALESIRARRGARSLNAAVSLLIDETVERDAKAEKKA